mgnify:CR=1 FL=1
MNITLIITLIIPLILGWLAGLFINYASDVLPVTRRFSKPVCKDCGAPYSWTDYLTLRACRAWHIHGCQHAWYASCNHAAHGPERHDARLVRDEQ